MADYRRLLPLRRPIPASPAPMPRLLLGLRDRASSLPSPSSSALEPSLLPSKVDFGSLLHLPLPAASFSFMLKLSTPSDPQAVSPSAPNPLPQPVEAVERHAPTAPAMEPRNSSLSFREHASESSDEDSHRDCDSPRRKAVGVRSQYSTEPRQPRVIQRPKPADCPLLFPIKPRTELPVNPFIPRRRQSETGPTPSRRSSVCAATAMDAIKRMKVDDTPEDRVLFAASALLEMREMTSPPTCRPKQPVAQPTFV